MEDLATHQTGIATQAFSTCMPRVGDSVVSGMVAKEGAGVTAQRTLDAETVRAALTFIGRLPDRYAPFEVFVYGSRARGAYRPDSDVDLAVVLEGQPGDRIEIGMEMAGIAVDVLRETGLLVEALPFWNHEFEQPERSHNPALIENIKRDGLRP